MTPPINLIDTGQVQRLANVERWLRYSIHLHQGHGSGQQDWGFLQISRSLAMLALADSGRAAQHWAACDRSPDGGQPGAPCPAEPPAAVSLETAIDVRDATVQGAAA